MNSLNKGQGDEVFLKNLTAIILPTDKISLQVTNMNVLELTMVSSALLRHVHSKLVELEGHDMAEVIQAIIESIDAVISLAKS